MKFYEPCSTMTVNLINYIQEHPETVHHLDQFLVRYQNPVFNFIKLTIGDYHDSADLTNKVLLTLARKVKEIKVKQAFHRLVLKVIQGEISNYWKGRKSQKAKLLKEATIWHNDEKISLVETLEGNEATAEEILNLLVIRDMIENASDPMLKEIFWLKYRDDESIANIAHKLNLTEYQVKKYIQEIQQKVQDCME